MISKILMFAVLLVGVSSIAVAQNTSQPPVSGSGTTVPGASTSGTMMKGETGSTKTFPAMSGSSTDSTSVNKQSTGATGMPKTGTAEPAGSGASMGGSTSNPTTGGSKQ
jgi:hypothetical protein